MEHPQPEHPAAGKTEPAEGVETATQEDPSNPGDVPQVKEPVEADGAPVSTGKQGPETPTSLPAQSPENLESPPASGNPDPAGSRPEVETVGASSSAPELPQSPRTRQPELDFYCVKWIPWKGERTPIITQNANGPCPLLAIMNILFLQWKVREGLGES